MLFVRVYTCRGRCSINRYIGRYIDYWVSLPGLWTAKALRWRHSLVRKARFSQLLCLILFPKGKHLLFKSQPHILPAF